jgi:hypothetical protein
MLEVACLAELPGTQLQVMDHAKRLDYCRGRFPEFTKSIELAIDSDPLLRKTSYKIPAEYQAIPSMKNISQLEGEKDNHKFRPCLIWLHQILNLLVWLLTITSVSAQKDADSAVYMGHWTTMLTLVLSMYLKYVFDLMVLRVSKGDCISYLKPLGVLSGDAVAIHLIALYRDEAAYRWEGMVYASRTVCFTCK